MYHGYISLYLATNHLQKERDSVNEKITLLQEELALIDTHLTEQNDKLQEVPFYSVLFCSVHNY